MIDILTSLADDDSKVIDRDGDQIVLVRKRRGWMIRTNRDGNVEESYRSMNNLASLISVSVLMGAVRLHTHFRLRRHKRVARTRSGRSSRRGV